jgi:hypothetical protein
LTEAAARSRGRPRLGEVLQERKAPELNSSISWLPIAGNTGLDVPTTGQYDNGKTLPPATSPKSLSSRSYTLSPTVTTN